MRKIYFVYIILVFSFLISTSCLFSASVKGYPLYIDISTTSDWSTLDILNSSFSYLDDTIIQGNSLQFLKYGILTIEKKQYDSTIVHVQYRIFLPKPIPKQVKFLLKKGSIGETKVVFHTQSETIISSVFQQMENYFTVRRDIINNISTQQYVAPQRNPAIIPMVLSFYYPWYADNWLGNDKKPITNVPILGFYDSGTDDIIRKHILLAKNAAIDGFIVSWWGENTLTDSNIKKIIPISESLNFKISLYLESANSIEDFIKKLNYIESMYAKSNSFIRLENRPVLFLFSRIIEQIPLELIRSLKTKFAIINYGLNISNLNGLSGYHEYLPPGQNNVEITQKYLLASQIARKKNKLMAASVMPGYDDRRLRKPGALIERKSGKYYKDTWQAALDSRPDWILITSFNEWFEGTEIEPSVEYGDFYLNLTRQYAQRFKANNLR